MAQLVTKSLGCFCLLSAKEGEVTRQLKAYHVSLLTSLAELQSTARSLESQLAMKEVKEHRLSLLQERLRTKEAQLLSLLSSSSSDDQTPLARKEEEDDAEEEEEVVKRERKEAEKEEEEARNKKNKSKKKEGRREAVSRAETMRERSRRRKTKEAEEMLKRQIEEISLALAHEDQEFQKQCADLQEVRARLKTLSSRLSFLFFFSVVFLKVLLRSSFLLSRFSDSSPSFTYHELHVSRDTLLYVYTYIYIYIRIHMCVRLRIRGSFVRGSWRLSCSLLFFPLLVSSHELRRGSPLCKVSQ